MSRPPPVAPPSPSSRSLRSVTGRSRPATCSCGRRCARSRSATPIWGVSCGAGPLCLGGGGGDWCVGWFLICCCVDINPCLKAALVSMAGVCEMRIECPRSVSRCRVCKVGYLGDIPLFLVLCDGSVLVLANECLDPAQVGLCRRFFCDQSARLYLLADTGSCITLRAYCLHSWK